MKSIIIFSISVILLIGYYPVFAESENQSQTLRTDRRTLDVKLSYEPIILEELTILKTDFINPQTQRIQEHIDWKFSVSKNGETIWGPTQLSHTSVGSLNNLKYEFEEDGLYSLEFTVEGILFQPIPSEVVTFEISVGNIAGSQIDPPSLQLDAGTSEESQIPEWIKNNAGWWSQGLISDDDFINGIQYLIQVGIISVAEQIQVQTFVGQFTDADFIHRTSGTATLVIDGDTRILEFENFETLNGPDLYVYLSSDKSDSDYINLGMLDKFKGKQTYEIKNSIDLKKYNNVLVWCKAFGVLFGSAELS